MIDYYRRSAGGMQTTLRRLERRLVSLRQKDEIIESLREEDHEYTSFFVCRDPIEKLLSVYYYMMDLRVMIRGRYSMTK